MIALNLLILDEMSPLSVDRERSTAPLRLDFHDKRYEFPTNELNITIDGLNPNITNIFLITTPSNKVGNVKAICEMEPINIVFLNSKYSGLLYTLYI